MQFKNLFTLLAVLAAVSAVVASSQESDAHAPAPAQAGPMDQNVLAGPDGDDADGDDETERGGRGEVNGALSGNAASQQQQQQSPPGANTAFTGNAQTDDPLGNDAFTSDVHTEAGDDATPDNFSSDLYYRSGRLDDYTHRLLHPFLRQQTNVWFVLENRRHRTCMTVRRPPLHHYHHRWQLAVKRCHNTNVHTDTSLHLRWYYADANQPHLRKLAWTPDHGATWLCATSSYPGTFFEDCRKHGDLIGLSKMDSRGEVMLQLEDHPNRCYGDKLHHGIEVEPCQRARTQLNQWTPRLIRPYQRRGSIGGVSPLVLDPMSEIRGQGRYPDSSRPTVIVRDQVRSGYTSVGRYGGARARARRSSVTQAWEDEEEEEEEEEE